MIKTVTLTGTEQAVTFAARNQYYHVHNLGGGEVLVSLAPNISRGNDDVLIVSGGGTGYVQVDMSTDTVYLAGSGEVQVAGTGNAFSPFKSGAKGGDGDDGGKEIVSDTGNIEVTAVEYPILALNLYGKSVQNTSIEASKNLFNFDAWKNGISGIYNGTAEYGNNSVKLTATAADCYTNPSIGANYNIPVEPNTTYTLSWQSDNDNKGILYMFFNNSFSNPIHGNNSVAKSKTFTTPSDAQWLRLRLGVTNQGESITYSNIQLELGSVATDYEEYISVATPENPVDIVNIGDSGTINIENIFTAEKNIDLEVGGLTAEGLNSAASVRMRSKGYIKIIPNTKYTLTANYNQAKGSIKISVSFYPANDFTTGRFSYIGWTQNGELTFTAPEEYVTGQDNYIRILFGIDGEGGEMSLTQNDIYDVNLMQHTVAEITSGLPLCSVGGIRDELIYNADGTGKIVKRTAKIDSYNGEAITTTYISSTGGLDTGAEVVYTLTTPRKIDLSTLEIAALMQLQTSDGITELYNSEGAEMKVKVATNPLLSEYVKPVIDGITARFEARIAALEAAVTNT